MASNYDEYVTITDKTINGNIYALNNFIHMTGSVVCMNSKFTEQIILKSNGSSVDDHIKAIEEQQGSLKLELDKQGDFIEKYKEYIDSIYYSPGFPGYLDAKASFESRIVESSNHSE